MFGAGIGMCVDIRAWHTEAITYMFGRIVTNFIRVHLVRRPMGEGLLHAARLCWGESARAHPTVTAVVLEIVMNIS